MIDCGNVTVSGRGQYDIEEVETLLSVTVTGTEMIVDSVFVPVVVNVVEYDVTVVSEEYEVVVVVSVAVIVDVSV